MPYNQLDQCSQKNMATTKKVGLALFLGFMVLSASEAFFFGLIPKFKSSLTPHQTRKPVAFYQPTGSHHPTSCSDDNRRCSRWAADGGCYRNSHFMLNKCKKSCNNCSPGKILKDFIHLQNFIVWLHVIILGTAGWKVDMIM